MTLPTDSDERKNIPLYSGCFQYFPAALAGVARWSKLGNDKHNPGQPLHHSRGKSADHADCVLRHLMDIGEVEAWIKRTGSTLPTLDPAHKAIGEADVQRLMDEADALSWRALALSQELHERYGQDFLAPGAKLPEPVNLPDGPPVASTGDWRVVPLGGIPHALTCWCSGCQFKMREFNKKHHLPVANRRRYNETELKLIRMGKADKAKTQYAKRAWAPAPLTL